MEVIGVRSSWLTVVTNSVFKRSTSTSRVMSRKMDTDPRYSSVDVTGVSKTETMRRSSSSMRSERKSPG